MDGALWDLKGRHRIGVHLKKISSTLRRSDIKHNVRPNSTLDIKEPEFTILISKAGFLTIYLFRNISYRFSSIEAWLGEFLTNFVCDSLENKSGQLVLSIRQINACAYISNALLVPILCSLKSCYRNCKFSVKEVDSPYFSQTFSAVISKLNSLHKIAIFVPSLKLHCFVNRRSGYHTILVPGNTALSKTAVTLEQIVKGMEAFDVQLLVLCLLKGIKQVQTFDFKTYFQSHSEATDFFSSTQRQMLLFKRDESCLNELASSIVQTIINVIERETDWEVSLMVKCNLMPEYLRFTFVQQLAKLLKVQLNVEFANSTVLSQNNGEGVSHSMTIRSLVDGTFSAVGLTPSDQATSSSHQQPQEQKLVYDLDDSSVTEQQQQQSLNDGDESEVVHSSSTFDGLVSVERSIDLTTTPQVFDVEMIQQQQYPSDMVAQDLVLSDDSAEHYPMCTSGEFSMADDANHLSLLATQTTNVTTTKTTDVQPLIPVIVSKHAGMVSDRQAFTVLSDMMLNDNNAPGRDTAGDVSTTPSHTDGVNNECNSANISVQSSCHTSRGDDVSANVSGHDNASLLSSVSNQAAESTIESIPLPDLPVPPQTDHVKAEASGSKRSFEHAIATEKLELTESDVGDKIQPTKRRCQRTTGTDLTASTSAGVSVSAQQLCPTECREIRTNLSNLVTMTAKANLHLIHKYHALDKTFYDMEKYFAKTRKILAKHMSHMQDASKKAAQMYDILDTQMKLCAESTIKSPEYLRNFAMVSSKPIAKGPTGRHVHMRTQVFLDEARERHRQVMHAIDEIDSTARASIEEHFSKLSESLYPVVEDEHDK